MGGGHQQQFQPALPFPAHRLITIIGVLIPFDLPLYTPLGSLKGQITKAEDAARGRGEQKCHSYSFRASDVIHRLPTDRQHTAAERLCCVSPDSPTPGAEPSRHRNTNSSWSNHALNLKSVQNCVMVQTSQSLYYLLCI